MAHPSRAVGFNYLGFVQVFVTATTRGRNPRFADPEVANFVSQELINVGRDCDVEVCVYCVMTDHVHALLSGVTEKAHVPSMMRTWKQSTGYWFSKRTGATLWRKNYWDLIIRNNDENLRCARYTLLNPVVSGLVSQVGDYKWFGSDVWSRDDLIEIATIPDPPFWWR